MHVLACVQYDVHEWLNMSAHACTWLLISCHLMLLSSHRMNDQLRPILDLLREVEDINLSSEVLEPELHSIQQVQCVTIYI